MDASKLLVSLLTRGDRIEISNSRLVVSPRSGKRVPSAWLENNQNEIIADILSATRRMAYRYIRYTRSAEGYANGRHPGVTLHFQEVRSKRDTHLIFNAETTNRVGNLRPRKQFLPPRSGSLVKFWERTVGALPSNRRSRLWEHMGRLKPFLYQFTVRGDGKGENNSAGLLNIPFEEIARILANRTRTDHGPSTYRSRTQLTDETINQEQTKRGLQRYSTASQTDYETSMQDRTIPRLSNSQDISNQSVEEWLAPYNSVDRTEDLQ